MTGIAGLLTLGALAALANLVGGLLIASSGAYRQEAKLLKYLIALGAGFMLAAIFIEIIPETVSLWSAGSAPTGVAEGVVGATTLLLAGYLLIQLFEHTVAPHFHFGEETHEAAMLEHHAAVAGLSALMVHTFFDGVSIAVATLVSSQLGVLIFIAIPLRGLTR